MGSELKSLFSRIGIDICAECGDKAKQWDRLTIEECKTRRWELVAWLNGQAAKNKLSIYETAMALAVEEPLLSAKIGGLKVLHPLTDVSLLAAGAIVDLAIDRAIKRNVENAKVSGSIPVIVSVAPRPAEIHLRTFASIHGAGFTSVFATCEPGTHFENIKATVTAHSQQRGQWRNFIEALKIGLKLDVPYFVTMEDDVELCRGTADYLARAGWPSKDCGCVQLYSALPMGSYPVGLRSRLSVIHCLDMLGACALMFRRDAAIALVEWANTKGWRGDAVITIDQPENKKAADTFVGDALTFLGFSIWTHNPSLALHIGDTSTLGHQHADNLNRFTLNFPGIDADLLTIFANEIK